MNGLAMSALVFGLGRVATPGKDLSRVMSAPTMSAPVVDTAGCCDVIAHATLRVLADQFPALRQKPGVNLPPAFLKNADEQTVAGLSAVLQAISLARLDPTHFADW